MIDWSTFRAYLSKTCRPNTVKARMCYARQYAPILLDGSILPSSLLQLQPQKRLNVIKLLTALSKYLGCYDSWQQTRKQHNLKWTTGSESTQALQRFFNSDMSLDHMLKRIKEMMRVLPAPMAAIVRFACITGLRPSEACKSVKLLTLSTNGEKVNKLFSSPNGEQINYYNPEQQTLEHFRFPDVFLRPTKKAYLSYITLDNLQPIANLGSRTQGGTR